MTETYYFIAASKAFIESEPLDEVLEERKRNYAERGKPIDFFYVERPAFLSAPEFDGVRARIDAPAIAIVSSDPKAIRWLKLRLEFVEMGEFVAPSDTIPDPLASLLE
ncbi:MgPME-cyclase complex family protein [Synechococcus sp. PCC 7336]|uniref:MgPME-cyclase complex family protein n=1 Tax=Synechococcus sp. PCC 7336 TaxID=195250 RepID=UPI0003483A71|nr:MgPME-cyclase complex family protein [Synechococcus sp. PCC 7336]